MTPTIDGGGKQKLKHRESEPGMRLTSCESTSTPAACAEENVNRTVGVYALTELGGGGLCRRFRALEIHTKAPALDPQPVEGVL